jgi:cytochrome c oxidase cbb3-type subunit 3
MHQFPGSEVRSARRVGWWIVPLFVLIPIAVACYWVQERRLDADLVRAEPAQVVADARLRQHALALAPAIYRDHCQACHGASMQGNPRIGAPNLKDSVWLYGDGGVGDIENTILYGIRSGHPKARNVTDMPAEGRTRQLTAAEVADAVQYVLMLSTQVHDEEAAQRGRKLYFDKGNCFDCHASDAEGNTDYGTPSLKGPVWNYGGDPQTLYQTVYNGRHGLCPAWIGKLGFAQIRALAVYLYEASQRASDVASKAASRQLARK